jgi:peroxiredoxin
MGILRRLSRWIGTDKPMTHIVAGNMAPGFSLKGLDGKNYSLGALIERGPVVAAFFKISCPVCQFTFPFLERLYKRYGGDGVTFLGISQDDARATQKFASEYGVTFPVLLDEDGYPVSNGYGLASVPTILWSRQSELHGFQQERLGNHRRGTRGTQENFAGAAFQPRRKRSGKQTGLRIEKLGPVGTLQADLGARRVSRAREKLK